MIDFRLLGQAPDIAGNALAAFQAGRQQATMRTAGNALAMGNAQGAANALYGGGMIDQGMALQDRQAQQQRLASQDQRQGVIDQRQAAQFARQQQQWSQEDKELLTTEVLREAKALRIAPEADRPAMYIQRAAPLLQKIGVPPEEIQRVLADGKLTNNELDQFIVQLGGGTVEDNRGVVVAPGGNLVDPRTGKPMFQAPFAPQIRAVGEGQTLVEINPGGGGGPMAAPATGGGMPRGIRNNNPGNIEDGPFAKSLPGYVGGDGRFARFETPEQGSQAQVALLQNYGRRGVDTPAAIVGRWAPPSDGNPTPAYAQYLARALGVGVNDKINLADPAVATRAAQAIAQFENGGQSASGSRVVAQGAPKGQSRPATAEEKAQYGLPPEYPARITAQGEFEPIQGAESITKRDEKADAKVLAADARKSQATFINGTVDEALSKLGRGEAGIVGKTASAIPGTKSYDLAQTLQTIKANLGFQELAAMRAASPTGGALGAIAVQELNALQATVASLDQGQSPAQLKANLNKVKQHYQKWLDAVARADAAPGGSGGGGWQIIEVRP